MKANEREELEIEFWRTSPEENPAVDSLGNQLDKSADALIFKHALDRLSLSLDKTSRVLELGGGQGWASCVLKRCAPDTHVTTTDISPFAIASVGRWERIYNTKLDNAVACPSSQISAEDNSLDFIFCFAAAHHFARMDETLHEIHRTLNKEGLAAFLYEPTSPKWLAASAKHRVNAKRPEVFEDVLIPSEIRKLATEQRLACEIDFWPSTLKRSGVASFYYAALAMAPIGQSLVPCTANILFRKEGTA